MKTNITTLMTGLCLFIALPSFVSGQQNKESYILASINPSPLSTQGSKSNYSITKTLAPLPWNLTGNTGTVAGTNYLGTGDAVDLVFKTNATEKMRISVGGNVGIGVSSPSYSLDVLGDININVSTMAFRIASTPVLRIAGTNNMFVGSNAGLANTTGNDNVFSGYQAGYSNIDGYKNTFNGSQAGYSNDHGMDNVFSGYQAGYSNTQGSGNVFCGSHAGYANINGTGNVFLGISSGSANTSGYGDIFIGSQAGQANVNGYNNTFIGTQAGYYNYGGANNIFIGQQAGQSNVNGNLNLALGYEAGALTTASSGNTFVGPNVGMTYDNGNNNTFIGYAADANAASYTNSTVLGNGSTMSASNQVRIGNASVTSIGGQVGWTTISDARVKKNVQSNVPGLEFIKKLRPVTYNLDPDAMDKLLNPDGVKKEKATQEELDARAAKAKIVYTGFIAQEVEKAAGDVGYSFSGVDAPKNDKDAYGLRYAEFTVPLIKAVQEIADENLALKKEVQNVNFKNDSLSKVISNFNARLSQLENLSKETDSKNIINPTSTKQAFLEQNAPNPFTDNTVIKYYVPSFNSYAVINLHSQDGNILSTYKITERGNGQIIIQGGIMQSPGTYTYELIVDGQQQDVKKLIIIK